MQTVQPWMRLKVKPDTFFLPAPDGSVYFRNNVSSFRMDGTSVLSWIEQLLPAFDGMQSIDTLTDGLPLPYRDRVYEIADILYNNGFLRDVSTDSAHGLSESLLETYQTQIEFLDNLEGSGAYRFETYRNAKVFIVGGGSLLSPLVQALLQSGLSVIHVVTVDALPDAVRAMDAVLYVCDTVHPEALRRVETVCRGAQALFFCAVAVGPIGFVVPAVMPASGADVTFDSVWRRLHASLWELDLSISGFTDTAAAVLSNVLVFELFKVVTGVDKGSRPRIYVLNGETLAGTWHDVIPAAERSTTLVAGRVDNWRDRLLNDAGSMENLAEALSRFAELTSPVTGIFHVWDEGELLQIPFARCQVQPIDPLSPGPADLLPEHITTALTHDEARREAGLVGIETYVEKLIAAEANKFHSMCVGAGLTFAEAVGRGLLQALTRELCRVVQKQPVVVRRVVLGEVDDELCQFCLRSLQAVDSMPVIWRGDDLLSIPVIWAEHRGRFVGAVGFTTTMALRRVLTCVLLCESSDTSVTTQSDVIEKSTDDVVQADASAIPLEVPTWRGFSAEELTLTVDLWHECGVHVELVDMAVEPFLQETVAAVVGVTFERGESS
ncbi:hypothetical protein [Alicyclobacillus sp. ALC3]|uniref:hypothetical protein n=1 Tax=Alicyclobacillus sp. ALC3 TaxID=2796143 RepID=UPI0023789A1C|nr:hypothetical protein [Alicyclobacillus sp. ALC3]WDL98347.1 hypothetical protein JC200_06580 [Alicyclobacillus sp. ALC3]